VRHEWAFVEARGNRQALPDVEKDSERKKESGLIYNKKSFRGLGYALEVTRMCYTLNEIKEKTVPVAKAYGIQSLGIFGSYARNEATDESDVDLCVEKGALRSLLQYFAFVHELEEALGCHVDVITTEIEDTDFLNHVLEERVLLYER
jgi:hypothetical protein